MTQIHVRPPRHDGLCIVSSPDGQYTEALQHGWPLNTTVCVAPLYMYPECCVTCACARCLYAYALCCMCACVPSACAHSLHVGHVALCHVCHVYPVSAPRCAVSLRRQCTVTAQLASTDTVTWWEGMLADRQSMCVCPLVSVYDKCSCEHPSSRA